MIKWIIKLAVLGAVILVFWVSNPDEQQHKAAITSVIEQATDGPKEEGIGRLKEAVRNKVVSIITNEKLDVQSYGVFSIGRLENADGDKHLISIGVLGHVFTPGEGKLIQSTNTGSIKDELKKVIGG